MICARMAAMFTSLLMLHAIDLAVNAEGPEGQALEIVSLGQAAPVEVSSVRIQGEVRAISFDVSVAEIKGYPSFSAKFGELNWTLGSEATGLPVDLDFYSLTYSGSGSEKPGVRLAFRHGEPRLDCNINIDGRPISSSNITFFVDGTYRLERLEILENCDLIEPRVTWGEMRKP